MKPKVLLLDEPFGALDALTRAHLQDAVMQIQQALNTTIVMITHDVDEAVLLSDRVLMMTNGPAATVGEILASICRVRAIAFSWRMTAVITTCASRSSISSMKNSRKRRKGRR
jgi:ABC-type nitrate/sulfonate/bicarbonate transport system ATPase subunit